MSQHYVSQQANLVAEIEQWPIAGTFTISRGSKTEAVVVTATITRGGITGRGECTPYARYGETPQGTLDSIESMRTAIEAGMTRDQLRKQMKPGAARNALDCALLDLECKASGRRAWDLLGCDRPPASVTAYTISVGTPESMAEATRRAAHRPLLKIKLAGDGDEERIRAVRLAAPKAELIVDANEAWRPENLASRFAACAEAGVTLIEQPLPAGEDSALADLPHPVPVCADESAHGIDSLAGLRARYEAINIKLDKTGGITEALALAQAAEAAGFGIMIGCMVATSLSMAPAMLLAPKARFIDLDGPLLLAKDRDHGLRYDGSTIYPPDAGLWG